MHALLRTSAFKVIHVRTIIISANELCFTRRLSVCLFVWRIVSNFRIFVEISRRCIVLDKENAITFWKSTGCGNFWKILQHCKRLMSLEKLTGSSWKFSRIFGQGSHRSGLWIRTGSALVEVCALRVQLLFITTLWVQKGATLSMAVTLSILDGFAKFFHCCKEHQIFNKIILLYPPHLKCIAALPWETWKNQKFCTFRARKTCFKCDFLSSMQQISVKCHKNKRKINTMQNNNFFTYSSFTVLNKQGMHCLSTIKHQHNKKLSPWAEPT